MNNKEVITLLDEKGEEVDFTLLTVIELKDHRYALLLPVEIEKADGDADEDEMEVVVMRVEGENLLLVENEEELDQVLAYVDENNILDELS